MYVYLRKATVNIYLEHDTNDYGFVNSIADTLNSLEIFRVFVSPFGDLMELTPEMETELKRCQILVILLTRKSARSKLIHKEMVAVDRERKIIMPFFAGKIPKISKLLPLVVKYQEHRFDHKGEKQIIEQILPVVDLLRFQISKESIENARIKLKLKYQPKMDKLTRQAISASMQILFRELIKEIFEKLGYTIIEKQHLEHSMQYFDMLISKNKQRIWVKCILHSPKNRDILTIKSRFPMTERVWLVCTNPYKEKRAALLTKEKSISFFQPELFINQLDPQSRERFIRKLVSLRSGRIPIEEQELFARQEKEKIARLLRTPEDQNLEFKSTLRYDPSSKRINPVLEKSCLKTICAFMNANGGLLVIGVSDDKEILGLSYDFKTLKKQDADSFENHLTNIIGSRLKNKSLKFVKVSFVSIDEKEICIVKVHPSDQPVFLKEGNTEEFYVRTGNNSRPFSIGEAVDYIQKQWG